ncbi:hypothetical protein [Xanthomonas sp. GPE 39]|uniref:hypothetical protein n=1 Tax=Xanthomonas sp. GPE 39 TaxID=1583099 RepID=UPI000AEE679E|nr:hypothetical protein [Xanthomonas sp. GPE 39]
MKKNENTCIGPYDGNKLLNIFSARSVVRFILSLVLLAHLFFPVKLHAEQLDRCLKATLAVDAMMTKATLRIMADHRPTMAAKDWVIDASSDPGFYSYTLDIRHNILPEGREYPLVIRLSPDVAIISLRKLRDSTSKDKEHICEDVVLTSGDQSQDKSSHTVLEGYAFFKSGQPMEALPILADRRLPQNFVGHYTDSLRSSQKFYRSLLGVEKRNVVSVLFLIDNAVDVEQGCRYAGSSLPGLLLIGLRSGCLRKEQDFPEDLLHFIAHENFHQWNFVVDSAAYDRHQHAIRLMLLEGGAELAADLFLSQEKGKQGDKIVHYVSAATETCIDAAAHLKRPVVDLINDGQSGLAYPCGEVYTFLRMISLAREPFAAFRRLWKPILLAPGNDMMGSDGPLNKQFLKNNISQDAFAEIFSSVGYRLEAATQPDKSQRFRVAVELMREILHDDCRGSYGLYTGGSEIVIDPSSTRCQNLHPGGKPAAINDFNIYEAPLEARRIWLAACDASTSVRVSYYNFRSSDVRCTSEIKDFYVPLRLSRVSQRSKS